MTNLPDKTPPHGGDVYHLARTLGIELADLLDFSASINPLGFPPGLTRPSRRPCARSSITRTAAAWNCAPTLAAYHHLSPEEILVGNGSTELLYLAGPGPQTQPGPHRDPGLQRIRTRPERWPGCRWPFSPPPKPTILP